MKNGYEILWTDFALTELENTIQYLQYQFTKKEIKKLVSELENTLYLISNNPYLFSESGSKKTVRKVTVLKYNSLYYRINQNRIEILSFFSNRQNPEKRKFNDDDFF